VRRRWRGCTPMPSTG